MSPRKKESNGMRIALLGFFLENAFHGYELYKIISQSSEFKIIWDIKQSLFYNHLEILNQEGFLNKDILGGSQYPDRKVYKLSALGRDYFLNWLVRPVNHGREMRQEFLAKIYFALKQDQIVALKLIQTQKQECFSWIELIKKEKVTNESDYQGLIFEYRIKQIEAMINWLNYVEKSKILKDQIQQ